MKLNPKLLWGKGGVSLEVFVKIAGLLKACQVSNFFDGMGGV